MHAELAMLIGGKVQSIEYKNLDGIEDEKVFGLRIKGSNMVNGKVVKFDRVIWMLSDFEGNGAGNLDEYDIAELEADENIRTSE